MRERRSIDRGIDARRTNPQYCDVCPSETLARYLTAALPKAVRREVEEHLQDCAECWHALDSAYKLLTSH
jgi:hypothetical protein